jgi:hypothetical protein
MVVVGIGYNAKAFEESQNSERNHCTLLTKIANKMQVCNEEGSIANATKE